MRPTALIAGASGIVGANLARHLVAEGWRVYGLARNPPTAMEGVEPLGADLLDAAQLRDLLGAIDVSHLFITAWMRRPTEAENCAVNGAMVRNLLEALAGASSLAHVALVTGLKHYLGSFESYGKVEVVTPFRESQGRVEGPNFYYDQEDAVFAAARARGFGWSVHRAHSIIGYALGNAMNMGQTLAAYATLCRETGRPFVFPGSRTQWERLSDLTDARLLARHLAWAAVTPAARDEAFNIVNGDIFRWNWLWPQLAAFFGLEPAPYPGHPQPLEAQMEGMEAAWRDIAARHGLAEPELGRVASFWHTDADLGREVECVTDMSKSRQAGFAAYQYTPDSFLDLFRQLAAERIIPSYR